MVVTARKATYTRKPSAARRGDKIGRYRINNLVSAIAVTLIACAGVPKGTSSGCPRNVPCSSQSQVRDVKVEKLVAAAGSDAVLVAALPPNPWAGLGKLVAGLDIPSEASSVWSWIDFKNNWSLLKLLFRLTREPSNLAEPVPEGWDQKRPLVVALVRQASGSDIESINAASFDGANLPIHIRVIVPAENPTALGAALQKTLAHEGWVSKGRYLLEWNAPSVHLAAAVIPAEDHVRLELLYFLSTTREDKAHMLAKLEATVSAPKPRTVTDSGALIERLAARGGDIVIGFQPMALARELVLEAPIKVMAALESVDPAVKQLILTAGLGEILESYLLATSGKAEISEAALAMNFENGFHAVSIAQLTPIGQRQFSRLVGRAEIPLELPANALASVALTLQPGSNFKSIEPVLGAYLNGVALPRFVEVFKEAGAAAWPALFAKPTALWRKLIADAQIPGVVGDLTMLPQEASFDFLDMDAGDGPAFRWRAYASNGAAPAWASLVRLLAHAYAGSETKEVQQQKGANGTCITWSHKLPAADAPAPSHRRSDVSQGTFAVAHVNSVKLANRVEQVDTDWKQHQQWLLRLLRRVGPVNASMRLQGSWLITEVSTGITPPRAALDFDPPVLSGALEVKPTPGRAALEQAIAEVAEVLTASSQASNRAAVLSEEHARLQSVLAQAKSDPHTSADAIALERMFTTIEKSAKGPLEQKPVSDPRHVRCGRGNCLVGKETCCAETDVTAGACVETVAPGKDDKVQLLASQILACERAQLPTSTLARCDESLDCRENEACCEHYIYSGASANFCEPIKRAGRSPCPINELCIEGSPCRAPGSVCINGTCQKAVGSLQCGAAICTLPNSTCCLDEMRCAAPSECRVGALRCAHHSDCLKGQYCEISNLGTQCVGTISWGVAGSVCDKDTDCGPDVSCNQKKPRCVPSEYPGIRYCACE